MAAVFGVSDPGIENLEAGDGLYQVGAASGEVQPTGYAESLHYTIGEIMIANDSSTDEFEISFEVDDSLLAFAEYATPVTESAFAGAYLDIYTEDLHFQLRKAVVVDTTTDPPSDEGTASFCACDTTVRIRDAEDGSPSHRGRNRTEHPCTGRTRLVWHRASKHRACAKASTEQGSPVSA